MTSNRQAEIDEEVSCSDCGHSLPVERIRDAAPPPCPACGSVKKHIKMSVREEAGMKVHDSLRGRVKSTKYSAKKNPRVDFFSGADLRKLDRKWMQKERLIDKDNDRYMEKVNDPDTGEVVHYTDEPLSEHFGHGSAKVQKGGNDPT
ncbi:hypothetical protein SB781_27725 [Paraburkholderia sp. SIMBA_061]